MYHGKLVFAQIMEHWPAHEFQKCVTRYNGNYKTRGFSCHDQFLCMSFAQLTFRESLRDIEIGLRSVPDKLYHLGFRGHIARSTLADANETRDWRIYADFAQVLIGIARPMYATEPLGIDLNATVYALDSTTIDLCLAVFPWAHFREKKAAVKVHTLLDLRGPIPTFIEVFDGKRADVNVLDDIAFEPGAFYIMDRAYLDFGRLHTLHRAGAFFVTRTKAGVILKRRYSRPVLVATGLRSDQTVVVGTSSSAKRYPDTLRRIRFIDPLKGTPLIFLTNNFGLPALLITRLYKSRWQVELFFKWIKQHLRIKAFYGHSENAVKTQIWIAVATYVLIAILKKRLGLEASLHEILQVLSLNLFEKTPILQACGEAVSQKNSPPFSKQLNLLDL